MTTSSKSPKTPTRRKTPARRTASKAKAVTSPTIEKAEAVDELKVEVVETPVIAAEKVKEEVIEVTPEETAKVADPAFDPFSFGVSQGCVDMFTQMQKNFAQLFENEAVPTLDTPFGYKTGENEALDAFIQSSTSSVKGMQNLSALLGEMTQSALEENWAFSQKMMTITDPEEWLIAQNEGMQKAYDRIMADTTRLTQVSGKIAEEIVKPLQECYIHSMDTPQ